MRVVGAAADQTFLGLEAAPISSFMTAMILRTSRHGLGADAVAGQKEKIALCHVVILTMPI